MRRTPLTVTMLLAATLAGGCMVGDMGPMTDEDLQQLEQMPLDELEQMARDLNPQDTPVAEAFVGRTGTGVPGSMQLVQEGVDSQLQQVEVPYEVIDGQRVTEGDILLSDGSQPASPGTYQPFGYAMGKAYRWPGGVIPYDKSSMTKLGYSFSSMMLAAMRKWEDRTSRAVRFVRRTTQKNYLYFTRSPKALKMDSAGCASYLGRIGGRQPLLMSSVCGLKQAIHELGHAIGLGHEHQRSDRDKYIKILWNNIPQRYHRDLKRHGIFTKVFMFGKKTSYDTGSIMHYASYSNSKPWLLTRSGKLINNSGVITYRDAYAVRWLYGKLGSSSTTTTSTSTKSVTCPPAGISFSKPPHLGNLSGRSCSYSCWGKGTLYNACGISKWQFCLPTGKFAPCQAR